MSHDLEVRADASYSRAVPLPQMVSIIESLPGVTKTGPRSFVLDRLSVGIHVNVDVGYDFGEDEDSITEPDEVNAAGLSVPYPLLDKSGPVALEMAFQIAEKLAWSVYDPQGDCDLSRESSGQALRLQQSSGMAAKSVLERAAAAEASLGELFNQEMWNHSLVVGATAFVVVAVASIWLMFSLEWPKERFEKYLPWSVTVGGLLVLWLKSLVQAYLRLRRIRQGDRQQPPVPARGERVAQSAKDSAKQASERGCLIGLLILIAIQVWWLLGGWPVNQWFTSFAKRYPLLVPTLLLTYAGYLIRSGYVSRRRYGPSEVGSSDLRWGLAMAGLGVLLLAVEFARQVVAQ
jgi:hypothetical protein